MKEKLCKHCTLPISRSKRTDAIFCSIKCGSDYRNKRNTTHEKERKVTDRRLKKNRNIIKDLVERGFVDVPKETLIAMGFDPEYYTGIIECNSVNGTTEYRIFEFSFMIYNERCKLKKLNNGRI